MFLIAITSTRRREILTLASLSSVFQPRFSVPLLSSFQKQWEFHLGQEIASSLFLVSLLLLGLICLSQS